jgi:hypothetical protein
MDKVRRNRAVLSLILILALLAAFAVQHYGIYDLKAAIRLPGQDTSFDRLEESGFADVFHFGHVESRWASNMVVHVAVALYPPEPDFSDAYVVIESELGTTTYVVKRGDYVWTPEAEEPPDVQWSHWNAQKYKYYSENGMFPPGKGGPAQEAIQVLIEWARNKRDEIQDKAMREWLYVLIKEACQYEKWDFIEIDLFSIAKKPEPVLVATRAGKPNIMAGYEAVYTHTVFIYRKSAAQDWYLDDILVEGELTEERTQWMFDNGQIQMQPAATWFGPIPYAYDQYGFNDGWQGREIFQ